MQEKSSVVFVVFGTKVQERKECKNEGLFWHYYDLGFCGCGGATCREVKMAAPSTVRGYLQRTLAVKYQVRMASSSVVDKLKKLVRISKKETDIAVSDAIEVRGEFLYQNVEERMKSVTSKSFPSFPEENWKEITTTDIPSKYKLLKYCYEEFGRLPPSNVIHDCSSVNDFVTFYETKRHPGVVPEIWRLQNQKLPRNLSFEAALPMKRA